MPGMNLLAADHEKVQGPRRLGGWGWWEGPPGTRRQWLMLALWSQQHLQGMRWGRVWCWVLASPHLHSCSALFRLRCCLTVLVTRPPSEINVRGQQTQVPAQHKSPLSVEREMGGSQTGGVPPASSTTRWPTPHPTQRGTISSETSPKVQPTSSLKGRPGAAHSSCLAWLSRPRAPGHQGGIQDHGTNVTG